MPSSELLLLTFVILSFAFAAVHKIVKYKSIKHIRGPQSSTFILGHELEMRFQSEVGDLEFKWIRDYGSAFRVKGCFGEDVLVIADAKALQHILHTSGYHYPKRADVHQSTKLLTGRGIISAEGDDHKRHRKIMNPAFSAAQLRSFLPLFRRSASHLSLKWKEQLQGDGSILNVYHWLSRTTLDVIGETAFDYRFDALDDSDNELSKVFHNLFSDSILFPPAWDIVFKSCWRYVPRSILQYVEYIPSHEYRRFRGFLTVAKRIAKGLIERKASVSLDDKSSRDVMSILVQSNISEDPNRRLDEDEVLSQMASLMLAGHETTASSLSWLLLELARNPEDQRRVREEVAAAQDKIAARGDTEFTVADLESMVYTNAAIKESMRLHPIVPTILREAGREDVIPLSTPIETTSGEIVHEISVSKGQSILISICGYNRLPSVWGEDADRWNPERFLQGRKERQTSVGVYANLLNFSAGIRGCIGWRFSMIEMQAIFTELIKNFEFSLPGEDFEVQRMPAGIMVPMVKGKIHEGTQLPLRVTLIV